MRKYPLSSECTGPDELFMCQALQEAWKAFDEGEVPVGAVIVFQDTVIGRGHNQTELLQDATAHAEMLAVGTAAAYLSNWRLEDCTLYTTLEPCIMCAGACILSRVKRIVWGAPDRRHGANGSLIDLFSLDHPIHNVQISGGVLQTWCATPLQQFFRERRLQED